MDTESQGPGGYYGPNDLAYVCELVRHAAMSIKAAMEIWSEGHYPHSNAKLLDDKHPLVSALAELKGYDAEICKYANTEHDNILFERYIPSEEAQHRWDKYCAEAGK